MSGSIPMRQSGVYGVRAEPPFVIVRDGAVLPARCIKTNELVTDVGMKRKLHWAHPALFLIILVNLLIFLVVYLIVRKQCTIRYFMSRYAKRRQLFKQLFAVGVLLFGFFGMFVGTVVDSIEMIVLGIVLLCAGVVMLVKFLEAISLVKHKDGEFWIKGCCPEFVRSIQEESRHGYGQIVADTDEVPVVELVDEPSSGPAHRGNAIITKDVFWQIINRSRTGSDGTKDGCAGVLSWELSSFSPDEIMQFERIFVGYMDRAYTWDLWGAAYIIGGGCGDDSFMDFRAWLISRGRSLFDRAVLNPDCLAEIDFASDAQGGAFFETFAYVAGQVYRDKVGAEMPSLGVLRPTEPSGEPWDESRGDLKHRFPRLWDRYAGR